MSDPCTDPDDHARRTQRQAAHALLATPAEAARRLHDAECLLYLDSSMTCPDPVAHAATWAPAAAALLA